MVSVNWRLAPPEVLHIVNDAEAEILFVGSEYFPVIENIRGELRTVKKIVTLDGRHTAWQDFTPWRDAHPAVDPMVPTKPTDTAVQFYTSGTTGLPKGAELINSNFAFMMPVWTEEWLLGPGVASLVCLPMFHIGGAGWGIAGLFAGATNYVTREFVPGQVLELIERERLQVLLLVPGAADPRDRPLERTPDRLWCRANPGGPPQAGDEDLSLRLSAGLRAHRNDGCDHAAAARGPRSKRCQEAPVLRLCPEGHSAAYRWR
jgi:acyl-CoA synthetase (AMP-forming)/AMP-acid ligase II